MKNAPTGSFGSIHSRLREHISLTKQAASNEQDTGSESSAPISTSDAEVKDALPSGGQPGARGVSDLTNIGAGAGEGLPGVNTSPPTEEKERKEVSPEAKLAGIDPSLESLRTRLAGNIKLAANHLVAVEAAAAPAEKTAAELSSLGQSQAPTDSALAAGTKADTGTGTPVIPGVTGVSQTNPPAGVSTPTPQGPQEKSAATGEISPENLDAISRKVAQFTQDYSAGRTIAAALMSKMAAPSPEELDREKLAASVENATMISTTNALMDAGVSKGIITPKQANDLAALVGLRENPLAVAIEGVQQKLAELVNSKVGTREQKVAFLEKIADEDPNAAVAAAGGQAPMDPEQLKAAIGQLLGELQQAVQSGQMTEDQAIGLLQQLGLPVGGGGEGGGAPPDAGGGAPVVDPQDSGAPSGLPPGASIPPDAGAAEGAAAAAAAPDAGGGAPPAPKKEEGEGGGEKEKKPESDESKEKEDSEKKASVAHNRAVFGVKLAMVMSKKAIDVNAPPINLSSPQQIPPAAGTSLLPNYLGTAQSAADAKPSIEIPPTPAAPAMTGTSLPSADTPSAGQIAAGAPPAGGGGSGLSLAHILGGLGLGSLGGLGVMAYKGLSGGDDEEKRRKHAEAVDPSMAAAPAPGGDPAAAGGEPSVEQLLQELQQLVQSGQISEEEAQQIIAQLQQGGGDPAAAGGAPPPGAGAPVA